MSNGPRGIPGGGSLESATETPQPHSSGPVGSRLHTVPAGPVYDRYMARTNIEIDDDACEAVMRRYHLASKREAVNFALRRVASEALDLDQARSLRGSGWEGGLDELRAGRPG